MKIANLSITEWINRTLNRQYFLLKEWIEGELSDKAFTSKMKDFIQEKTKEFDEAMKAGTIPPFYEPKKQ